MVIIITAPYVNENIVKGHNKLQITKTQTFIPEQTDVLFLIICNNYI